MKNNQLSKELKEYQKEQEEIREIIGKIGGKREDQYRVISILFVCIIAVILVAGIIFKRISPIASLLVALFLAVAKSIWMLMEAQKSMHFQFWILNSLETRINDIYTNQRKILKLLDDKKSVENKIEKEDETVFSTDEEIDEIKDNEVKL